MTNFHLRTFETDMHADALIADMNESNCRVESVDMETLLSDGISPSLVFLDRTTDKDTIEILRDALPHTVLFVYDFTSHKFMYIPRDVEFRGFCHRCEAPMTSDKITTQFESDWGERKDFCQDCAEELSQVPCSLCGVEIAPGQLIYRHHGHDDSPDVVCSECKSCSPLSERIICCSI